MTVQPKGNVRREDLRCEWCHYGIKECECSDEIQKFHFVHKDDLDLVGGYGFVQ
jgi:hypothetical protein